MNDQPSADSATSANEAQDIQGHVVEFSGDQHGSRFIQHKLVAAQETTRSMVYREIIPSSVLILAHDVFGNYVGPTLYDWYHAHVDRYCKNYAN